MSNARQNRHHWKPTPFRAFAIATIAAGIGTATFAMTATARRPRRSDFAVLSGRLRPYSARASAINSPLTSPAGGVLAGEFNDQAVYVRTQVSWQFGEELCIEALNTQLPRHPVASACNPRAVAEAHGVTMILMPSPGQSTIAMFALVPNGVQNVTIDAASGPKTVGVVNNVAAEEGTDLESINYSVNGAEHSLAVPSTPPSPPPAG